MIILPDIHGRDFWKKAIEQRETGEKVVFLGDYTDPYPDEGIGKEVVPESLRNIIEFKKSYPSEVSLLLGNHDLSYVYTELPSCRFDHTRCREIKNLFLDNKDLFQIGDIQGKYIFSHSGIHPTWLEEEENYFGKDCTWNEAVERLNSDWWDSEPNLLPDVLNRISWYRGGYDKVGSCIWGDVREFSKVKSSEVFQIFGHTRSYGEVIDYERGWAMLDARKPFRLFEDLTTIEEIRLDES